MNKKLLFFLLIPSLGIGQTQIGKSIYGESVNEGSGASVAVSANGKIMAIGAPGNVNANGASGHVRIYENKAGTWKQIGQDIDGVASGDSLGQYNSIAISADGSIVALSSPGNSDNGIFAGHVRLFKNVSGIWTQLGNTIAGQKTEEFFGQCVTLSADGNIVAVSGGNFVHELGFVRVYENVSGVWTQIGTDIEGANIGDYFGFSISISDNGKIIAIGATQYGPYFGQVRIFENVSGTWIQTGNGIDGENPNDASGYSVSLSSNGKTVAIGSQYNDDNGNESGHVRVYTNIAGIWTQVGDDIDGEAAEDWSGHSVSLSADGTIVAIGAPSNDKKVNGGGSIWPNAGQVRIYQNVAGTWLQRGVDIEGDWTYDYFGFTVSLSKDGTTVAVGAPGNNMDGTQQAIGQVKVFSLSGILSTGAFVLDHFSIYPNPASDFVNIELDNTVTLEKVFVYDTSGKLIKQTSDKLIDLKGIAKGVYHVHIITNKGKATRQVVIK